MRTAQRHIIGKQQFDLTFSNQEEAKEWHKVISDAMRNELQQRLSEVFDGLSGEDQLIRIDTLEVEAGVVTEADFIDKMVEAVKGSMKSALPSESDKLQNTPSVQEGVWEALLFFLTKGLLPWWYNKLEKPAVLLEKAMKKADTSQVQNLKILAARNSAIADRLVMMVHDSSALVAHFAIPKVTTEQARLIIDLCQKVVVRVAIPIAERKVQRMLAQAWIHNWYSDTASVSGFIRLIFSLLKQHDKEEFVQVLAFLSKPENEAASSPLSALSITASLRDEWVILYKKIQASFPDFSKKIDKLLTETNSQESDQEVLSFQPRSLEPVANETVSEHADDQQAEATDVPETEVLHDNNVEPLEPLLKEGIYAVGGGLVLLHPYLPQLFKACNLLTENGKEFIDFTKQKEAISILTWLVYGVDEVAENQQLIPKLIAGYPLDEVTDPVLNISEETKAMCTELLQAVVTHWKALGNTSPAGLRETFLQREGRLKLEDRGWYLLIEQRSLDVLLNSLPWGIGMIKLPWLNKILFVDWA
ncbi:MAG: contractile injection system tape measure protein [Bacteroidia bacterium]